MIKVSKYIVISGIVLIIAVGIIHWLDARDALQEAVYKGWLFYANGVGSALAAYGILRGRRWGWFLGVFIAVASIAGYVASRTIGLPLIPPEPHDWFEPLGVASLITEGLFIVLFMKMNREK
ncbi:MAG: hypothetical protein ABIC68_08360 [Candidatus Omnitrophota bacterium]